MSLKREVAGRFEYGPAQYVLRRAVTDRFEEVVRSYGYEQIETSALERHEYLTTLWGEGMERDIFVVPPQDGQALALRFDATLPCIRMYLDEVQGRAVPRRWATVSECFRRDPVDADRRWSFLQLNAECFGYAGPQIDAEIMQVMSETLVRAGLRSGEFAVHLNDRRVIADLLAQSGGSEQRILQVLDRHGTDSSSALFDALVAEADLAAEQARWLVDVVALSAEPDALDRVAAHTRSVEARRGIESLAILLELKPAADLRLDLRVVRGLDYYSGLVFECFPAGSRRSALGAGGRYDGLVERLGGPPTVAVGFAIGVVPLLRLLSHRRTDWLVRATVDYVVGCDTMAMDALERCQTILGRLRSSGHRCVLVSGAQNLDSLTGAGREHGARWALLIPSPSHSRSLMRRDLRQDTTEHLPWTNPEYANDAER